MSLSTVTRTHDDCKEHYDLKSHEKLFNCDGCKMKGFGQRHQCKLCGHELHNECRNPRTTVSHDYFPGSSFTFHDEPFTSFDRKGRKQYSKICDACGKDIRGFSYHSERDNLDLHPCCLNLEKDITVGETVFSLRGKVSSKCIWCKKGKISDGNRDVGGWSYMSACKKYHLHVYCMAEMVHESCFENGGEMGLEKVEIGKLVKSKKNRASGSSDVFGMMKAILKIILAVLLGDPTMILPTVSVELILRGLQ